jgi:hypothetical protein
VHVARVAFEPRAHDPNLRDRVALLRKDAWRHIGC